jgi:DnaK suppressor protein
MSRRQPHLDRDFIDEQRLRLETLRDQARTAQDNAGNDEMQLQQEWKEPRDMADHGTDMHQQDVDDSVERVEAYRLDEIQRALEKIDEGTYGLSDTSGEPIPRERLQAKPEALRTVEEEAEEEAYARRTRGG